MKTNGPNGTWAWTRPRLRAKTPAATTVHDIDVGVTRRPIPRWAIAVGALAIVGSVASVSTPAIAAEDHRARAVEALSQADRHLNASGRATDGGGADGGTVTVDRAEAGAIAISLDGIDVAIRSATFHGSYSRTSGLDVSVGAAKDSLIQPTARGVRVAEVIKKADAPTETTYAMDGAGFRDINGAIIVERDGQAIGLVAPPWAIDANGHSVKTWYTVSDGALVQHVSHHGAAYPVVADPSVSFGWYVYFRYNKYEVKNAASMYNPTAVTVFVIFLCSGLAPWPAFAAACGAIGISVAQSVGGQMRDAAAANQCVEHRYTYPPVSALVGWRRYDC